MRSLFTSRLVFFSSSYFFFFLFSVLNALSSTAHSAWLSVALSPSTYSYARFIHYFTPCGKSHGLLKGKSSDLGRALWKDEEEMRETSCQRYSTTYPTTLYCRTRKTGPLRLQSVSQFGDNYDVFIRYFGWDIRAFFWMQKEDVIMCCNSVYNIGRK